MLVDSIERHVLGVVQISPFGFTRRNPPKTKIPKLHIFIEIHIQQIFYFLLSLMDPELEWQAPQCRYIAELWPESMKRGKCMTKELGTEPLRRQNLEIQTRNRQFVAQMSYMTTINKHFRKCMFFFLNFDMLRTTLCYRHMWCTSTWHLMCACHVIILLLCLQWNSTQGQLKLVSYKYLQPYSRVYRHVIDHLRIFKIYFRIN